MSTHRLYYNRLSADGIRRHRRLGRSCPSDGVTEVVLDQTAFYPTSGGQPFDTGTLGGFPLRTSSIVMTARSRISSRATPVAGAAVRGQIDWARRLDHMQQHTPASTSSRRRLIGSLMFGRSVFTGQ